MIGLTPHLRIWAYPAPCDMRKGHNGLLGIIERQMCRDVLSGDLFLFVNRGLDLTKILYFDGTSYVILYKRRLEGRFPRLWNRDVVDATGIRLSAAELALFLDGCHSTTTRPNGRCGHRFWGGRTTTGRSRNAV